MIELDIPGARPKTDADMAKVDRLDNTLAQKEDLMAQVRKHLRMNPQPHENKVTLPSIADRFDHTNRKQRRPSMRGFVTGLNIDEWRAECDREQPNPFSAEFHELESFQGKFTRADHCRLSEQPCTVKRHCSKPCTCPHAVPGKQCPEIPGPRQSRFSHYSKAKKSAENKKQKLRVPSYPLPPSALDYQPNYFTCIKPRPLTEHIKRSTFSKMQRAVFFYNLMSGYMNDGICKRKEQHKLDNWALERISQELDDVSKTFKKFIEESNDESVTLVKDQLHAGNRREQVNASLAKERGALINIRAEICRLEEQLSTFLLCRDLLLELSPTQWRIRYDRQARHFTAKFKWLADLNTLFSNYCQYSPETGRDFFLDEAMEMLFAEVRSMGPQQIYFTESWQIDMLLRGKELDCIAQIADVTEVERNIFKINELSKQLVKFKTVELELLTGKANEAYAEFRFQGQRVADLEATVQRVVPNEISTLCCGDIVLETSALVGDLYTEFFGHSKQLPDLMQMMISIEEAVWQVEERKLEINPKVWEHFEKKVTAEITKKNKAALKATRVIRRVKNLVTMTHAMMSQPPRCPRTWKLPVRRSNIPRSKKPKSILATSKKWKNGNAHFQHLQLAGILDNDDLEESVHRAISCFKGRKSTLSFNDDDGNDAELSSASSDVSSASMVKAIYSDEDSDEVTWFPSQCKSDDSHELELGYDSAEELIKQNYEKRKDIVKKPPVMYDAKMLDDRFMVEEEGVKLTEKNRLHSSRGPRPNPKNNPLSWR